MYAIWWGNVTRGHRPFAAKITGFDETYAFKREFVNGYWDFSEAKRNRAYLKRIYFPLEPNSIYDVCEVGQGKSRYRAFLLTDNQGNYKEIPKEEAIEWLKSTTLDATS